MIYHTVFISVHKANTNLRFKTTLKVETKETGPQHVHCHCPPAFDLTISN